MEMGLQLILTAACTVNLVLASLHPHDQIQVVDQAVNDQSKIHKNVQNLFYSIDINNVRESGNYHQFLKQGVAKEQQAFDTMKEELWMTRNRNGYKNADSYKTIHISKNSIATKRETKDGFKEMHYVKQYKDMKTAENLRLEDAATGEMFKKFHLNWMKAPEAPWPELQNLTLTLLQDICNQVLASIYKSHSTIDKFIYVDLPSEQLARRVVKRAAVKFDDGIKYMTLLKCQYKTTDFFLARLDKSYVYRMEKDREDETTNTFYFHDGPHRIRYNVNS